MLKNMTRKGLAFGAGLSLVVSSFAALPAQATGLTGFIPLVPTSGPENALAIETSDGASFSVTASPASTVMAASGTVKYLVTDPEAKFMPGPNTTGALVSSVADNNTTTNLVVNVASDMVAAALASSVADGSYLMYSTDGLNLDKGTSGAADVLVLPKDTLVEAFVLGDFAYFKSTVDITTANKPTHVDGLSNLVFVGGGSMTVDTDVEIANNTALANVGTDSVFDVQLTNFGLGAGSYILFADAAAFNLDKGTDGAADKVIGALDEGLLATISSSGVATITTDATLDSETATDTSGALSLVVFKAPSAVRSATNSYVVDTGVTAAGTTASFEAVATDAVSRSVTVQAFVDDFNDRVIGAGEYVSSAVTLSFLAQADISFSSSLDAPKPGDDKLTGYVTTSPLINDGENDIANWIGGVFTRQDSVTNALVYGGTQSTTTGRWPVEVALATNTSLTHWVNATTDIDSTNETWAKSYAGTGPGVTMDNPNTVDTETIARTKIIVKSKVATVTTYSGATEADTTPHLLRVGDKVKFENDADANDLVQNLTFTVTSVPSSSTFTFALDTADATIQALADGDHTQYIVATWADNVSTVDRVFAGDYKLTAAVLTGSNRYAAKGTTSGLGTQSAVAEDIIYTTTASASIQGRTIRDSGAGVDVVAKTGTLSVEVVATVVDEDDAAVGAGRAVVYTITRGAHTTIQVNGRTSGTTLVTDANGQVKFTVTDTTGGNGKQVTISATAEGVSTATSDITVKWEDAAYSMYDLATTDATLTSTDRQIAKSASYDLNLLVADQWLTVAPSADFRVAVTGSGATQGAVALTDGKATVKVTDGGVSSSYATTLTLQKKGTTGSWADTTSTVTITHKVSSAPALTLGANGSSLYGNTVKTSSAVAKVALVELDKRVDLKTVTPLYVNKAVLNGKATNATSGLSLGGSVVTISGPTTILFENGQVAKRGTLTAVADQTTGQFEFNLYSTTAQTDTVIKVTANGITKEIKVTFTGIGVGEGTKLDVTTPTNVQPASTFQVKAKLSDAFGNGVEATAGRVKVTYTGPGIVFGTLPDKTDKNGELMFSVLLGSNDSGSVTVTVSYDQNGDADFVDAKDLNTTKTITVGAAADSVTIGSFNGRVAVRVEGQQGARLSVKIGKKWYVATVPSNRYVWSVKSSKGAVVKVDAYINGDLENTSTITVK